MDRLAAPAPVGSAPLKVPPVSAVAGALASLLAEAMEEERAEDRLPAAEEGLLLPATPISPLWASPVDQEEAPDAAAGAYRLAEAGWVSAHEGRHLDVLV